MLPFTTSLPRSLDFPIRWVVPKAARNVQCAI